MHRLLALIALFKLVLGVYIFFASSADFVMLVSALLTALSASIVRTTGEEDVAFVLVTLILAVDMIGFFLAASALSIAATAAYVALVAWDAYVLSLLRLLVVR